MSEEQKKEAENKETGTDVTEAELKRAREEAAKYRTRLRELESRFDGIDPDQVKALLEEKKKAEEEKAKAAGKFEEVLKARESEWSQRLSELENQAKTWQQRYAEKVIDNELLSAAAGAYDPQDVVTLIKASHNIEVADDGSIKIMDGDIPMTDGKGHPLDIKGLVEKYRTEKPQLWKATPGGAGSHASEGPSSKPMTPQQKIAAGLRKLQAA